MALSASVEDQEARRHAPSMPSGCTNGNVCKENEPFVERLFLTKETGADDQSNFARCRDAPRCFSLKPLPCGSKDLHNRVLGPKYHQYSCIGALKPY